MNSSPPATKPTRPPIGPDVEECSHGDAAIAVRPRKRHHEGGERDPAGEQAKNAGQETDDEAHVRKLLDASTWMEAPGWKHLEKIQLRRYQLQLVAKARRRSIHSPRAF
jgi:hypothetical protein